MYFNVPISVYLRFADAGPLAENGMAAALTDQAHKPGPDLFCREGFQIVLALGTGIVLGCHVAFFSRRSLKTGEEDERSWTKIKDVENRKRNSLWYVIWPQLM